MAMTNKELRLLTLNVTERCEAACLYCHWWRVKTPHPPLKDLLNAVDDAKKLGTLAVRISGGEPLLRDDLPALIRAIRNNGMISMVCTAGNQSYSDLLALIDAGLDLLSVSLDMVEPETFRRLRGYSVQPVLRNLEDLALVRDKLGFEIIVSTVLTRLNLELLPGLLAFIKRLDLLLSVTPFQDSEPSRPSSMQKVAFDPNDGPLINAAVRQLETAAKNGLRLVNGNEFLNGFTAFLTSRQLPNGYVCRAGDKSAIRMTDGSVKLCHSLEAIDAESLSTSWESAEAKCLRERMHSLDCPRCWLSCHADERRPTFPTYGRPQLWEAL